MLESGASTCDDAGVTLSAVTLITFISTSEDAGGSKSLSFASGNSAAAWPSWTS